MLPQLKLIDDEGQGMSPRYKSKIVQRPSHIAIAPFDFSLSNMKNIDPGSRRHNICETSPQHLNINKNSLNFTSLKSPRGLRNSIIEAKPVKKEIDISNYTPDQILEVLLKIANNLFILKLYINFYYI